VSLGTFRSQKKLTYERVVALKAWRQKHYGIGSAAEE
jgi:hypothetical protein